MTDFEAIIGLEIHLQLNTASKMFCSCPSGAKTDAAPNTAICPLCTGQAGVLPVVNKQAVALALKAGLGLGAQINKTSVFARKNYFYPDLPKGYQISQDDMPILQGGAVEITLKDGSTKKIGLIRAHLEEDAGKSMHSGDYSLIDLNRSGVPLLEIVSCPDINTADEAYAYLTELKSLMQWLDISNCDMEKGELRVDVNISLRPRGQKEFGTRNEIKNLNSFKAVKDALNYEIVRQGKILSEGGKIMQQTLLWDDEQGKTNIMRSKETAQEYRYFPEPDLPPLILDDAFIEQTKTAMPELPAARKARFTNDLGLSAYDSGVLTISKALSDYFEEAVKNGAAPKPAANWIGTDILGKLNGENKSIEDCPLPAKELAELLKYIEKGTISTKIAREIFAKAWDSKKPVKDLVEQGGAQISDSAQLEAWAKEAIAANPKAAADIKAGNAKAIGAIVGNVMRMSKGKANPAALNAIILKLIN